MIKHRPVEAFREVMRSGSISAAAENLEISQPAVSRLIKDLEAEIGFALSTRHGSRIAPTTAAHEFFEVVERSSPGSITVSRAPNAPARVDGPAQRPHSPRPTALVRCTPLGTKLKSSESPRVSAAR
ncbi:helix-turn-helix domain-containing protein [Rhizobium halophytocola]|uniref:helix-turn-helix domain-containing protein n=1 Tax=Rhizobium halophytocola TaxID=735519 RepID=UPI001AE853F9|nr:LysR family transcriptional regulator [Rhizobium halophytocola]